MSYPYYQQYQAIINLMYKGIVSEDSHVICRSESANGSVVIVIGK